MDDIDPEEIDPDEFGTAGATFGRETYLLVAAVGLGIVGLVGYVFLDLPGWLRGETDIFGNYRYAQKVRQIRRDFTPMERVHAESFPEWIVARAREARAGSGAAGAGEAYRRLRSDLSDRQLRSILAKLRDLVESGDLARRSGEVVDLADRWNRRLETLGHPFFVRLRTARRGGTAFVYGGFYRRLARPDVRVGGQRFRALLLRRVDRTNLYESFLGATRQDAPYAFVVTDRVLDFALQDLLPVVAAGTRRTSGDEPFSPVPKLDPISKNFAGRVRRVLGTRLGSERYADLEDAARAWVRLDRVVESIRERRGCSNFSIANPPWNGYRPRTLDRLESFASEDELSGCPTVTYDEADAARTASEVLASNPSERAFESLLALLSRIITIHEGRHRADHARGDGGPACGPCPPGTSRSTRAELSAYTASFAWSETPALALFQACKARPLGAHHRALAFYLSRLGTLCDRPIPSDLGERSREIERELFGYSEPVVLPENFPDRLDLRIW